MLPSLGEFNLLIVQSRCHVIERRLDCREWCCLHYGNLLLIWKDRSNARIQCGWLVFPVGNSMRLHCLAVYLVALVVSCALHINVDCSLHTHQTSVYSFFHMHVDRLPQLRLSLSWSRLLSFVVGSLCEKHHSAISLQSRASTWWICVELLLPWLVCPSSYGTLGFFDNELHGWRPMQRGSDGWQWSGFPSWKPWSFSSYI